MLPDAIDIQESLITFAGESSTNEDWYVSVVDAHILFNLHRLFYVKKVVRVAKHL